MTEEEFFISNYPDSCYGDKPLSPHWDFFQDGVEFGERKSEKKIAELEKENAELKERLKEHESTGDVQFWENVWSWKIKAIQLTKARKIIENLLQSQLTPSSAYEETDLIDWRESSIKKAEQFLSEVEKCSM